MTFRVFTGALKHTLSDAPLSPKNKPNDDRRNLEVIFGPRFPDQVYYLLCQSLVSPQNLNTMVASILVEIAPLCNGETKEVQDHIRSLLSLRTETLALASFPMSKRIREFLVVNKHTFSSFFFSFFFFFSSQKNLPPFSLPSSGIVLLV